MNMWRGRQKEKYSAGFVGILVAVVTVAVTILIMSRGMYVVETTTNEGETVERAGGYEQVLNSAKGLEAQFKKRLPTATVNKQEAEETGPETSCVSDSDCWCRSFTGVSFVPGRKVPSTCNVETHRCDVCTYD